MPTKKITPSQQGTPPCAENPQGWDLDTGSFVDWLTALRICTSSCPMLQACWEARRRQYPEGTTPAGVIWAGVAFTDTGRPMTDARSLLAYGSERNRQRRASRHAAA